MRFRVIGCGAALAAAIVAQELTPRQLFYQEEAPAKPVAKAAPKAAPKKVAAKVVKVEAPKPAQTAAAQEPDSAPAPLPAAEPPRVINASYTAADRPLGLRYALVQVAQGSEREVSPSATFRAGDQVRVTVEGNRDGYLYVIARGSSGVWKPLFPASNINAGDNRLTARKAQRLPSDTQAFEFDEQAGQEQLFVVFSAEPVSAVEELIPSLTAPEKKELKPGTLIVASAAPISDAFVARLRNTYSRDLIVQTVTPSQPAQSQGEASVPENAVYVVSKAGGRVVADIRLEHK
jgi:hypothetical protein